MGLRRIEVRTFGHPRNNWRASLVPASAVIPAPIAYIKVGFVPLPHWISPLPWHSQGITAGTHMPPWDAVRVFKLMTELPGKDNTSVHTL
ncbi:hypothetical protein B0T20DRAFT_127632 [Sordaria brevicollis]|uniref:Uncharacterized protein n=1 Tax=Sordaria brevicollis TaxID=83679 RepID=A0AAE0PLE8_SORBR|nr:hypothetical protein B0T20DRAFT_127632 [Sordaria brevicollis]